MWNDNAGIQDMITLDNLSEDSMLTNLNIRYDKDLVYTYTGSILVAVNPFKELQVYTQEILKEYIGQRIGALPPHIFAIADNCYRSMKDESKNQSVIISGESGSGKTESTKLILQYLAAMTNQHSEIEQLILESSPVLEAFGNAKTVRNNNSSRFGKLIEIAFNESGFICGAKITQYLLERSRLVTQSEGERNYHIFYQLLSNDEDRATYQLRDMKENRYTNQSGFYEIKGVDDAELLDRTKIALQFLGMDRDLQNEIFAIVAAVVHVGNVNFKPQGDGCTVDGPLDIASNLLGVSPAEMQKALVNRTMSVRGQTTIIPLKPDQAAETREGLAKALYSRLFEWLVVKINLAIEKPGTKNTIGVLDIFGFENFKVNSFEQLCINYANEKLQSHFNAFIFKLEQDEYDREKINWSKISFPDNQACIDLIEKSSPPGILALLDEECKFPKASDQTFLEKIVTNHGKHANFDKPKKSNTSFIVKHYAGDVSYEVDNFLEKNKGAVQGDLLLVLNKSKVSIVQTLFQDVDDSATPRDSGAGAKKKTLTVGGNFKTQLGSLMAFLSATMASFIRCIKPNMKLVGNLFDADMVMAQLRYAGMMETIKIRRLGYPIRYTFDYFAKRFGVVAPSAKSSNDRESCKGILQSLEKGSDDWQLGVTKVFLREQMKAYLEDLRTQKIMKQTIAIQSWLKMMFVRQYFLHNRRSAVVIQSVWRGYRQKKKYIKTKGAAAVFQSTARMLSVRSKYKNDLNKMRAELKRRQEDERKRKEAQAKRDEEEKKKAEKESESRKEREKDSEKERTSTLSPRGDEYDIDMSASLGGDYDVSTVKGKTYDISTIKGVSLLENAMKEAASKDDGVVEEKKWRPPRLIVKLEEPPELLDLDEAKKISFVDYAHQNFQKPKQKGLIMRTIKGKTQSIAELATYQKKNLEQSLLTHPSAELSKIAVIIFQRILYHQGGCQGKTDMYTNIRFILKQGLFREDLRDEIYCQLIKQSTHGPGEMETKAWQLIAFCASTFTCSAEFLPYLAAHCLLTRGATSTSATLAAYSLRRLQRVEQLLKENPKKGRTFRTKVPSQKELEAIYTAQSVVIPIFLVDGSKYDLEVDQCVTALEGLGMLSSKLNLKDPVGFAIYESYESADGQRLERSLDDEIVLDIFAKAEYTKGFTFKFLFKRKLFLFPEEAVSLDPVENFLTFQQVNDSITRGVIPVTEEQAIELAAIQLRVNAGNDVQKAKTAVLVFDSYIPKQYHESRSPEKWGQTILSKYQNIAAGKSRNQYVEDYLSTASRLSLWGFKMFTVQHKSDLKLPRQFEIGVSIDGLHAINPESKKIVKSWYFNEVAIQFYALFVKLFLMDGSFIQLTTKEGIEISSLFSDYHAFLLSESSRAQALEDFHSNDASLLSYKRGDILTVKEKNIETGWCVGELNGTTGSFKLTNFKMLLPGPKDQRQGGRSRITIVEPKRDAALTRARGTKVRTGSRPRVTLGGNRTRGQTHLVVSAAQKGVSAAVTRAANKWNVLSEVPNNAKFTEFDVYVNSHFRTEPGTATAGNLLSGTIMGTVKGRGTNPLGVYSLAERAAFTKEPIKDSLLNLTESGLVKLASKNFIKLMKFMEDYPRKKETEVEIARSYIEDGIENPGLRDELYCQVVKQLRNNSGATSVPQGWLMMCLLAGSFLPSQDLYNYVLAFCQAHQKDSKIGKLAETAVYRIAYNIHNKTRKRPPFKNEIDAIRHDAQLACTVNMCNGDPLNIEIDSFSTANEILDYVVHFSKLQNRDGWYIVEVSSTTSKEKTLDREENICDILSIWEEKTTEIFQFMFLKRTFFPSHVEDDIVRFYLYYQMQWQMSSGKFPTSEDDAIRFAALKFQIDFGNFQSTDQVEAIVYEKTLLPFLPKQYVHPIVHSVAATPAIYDRLIQEYKSLSGSTPEKCRALYLDKVREWPLSKSALFSADYHTSKLRKSAPVIIAIDYDGIHLLDPGQRKPFMTWNFSNISNWYPASGTFTVVVGNLISPSKEIFYTDQGHEIAFIVQQYVDGLLLQTQTKTTTKKYGRFQ